MDGLFAEMSGNGSMIEQEPTVEREYNNKEFAVRDLDGYVIAFGQSL